MIKSCLLCENYKTHHSECEHCEDWDNFRISEDGKALREKIYGDGYQDGHRDGYDKGYDDAQRPQGEWVLSSIQVVGENWYKCSVCGRKLRTNRHNLKEYPFCHCGADMRGTENEL